jgi:hypothetical protein
MVMPSIAPPFVSEPERRPNRGLRRSIQTVNHHDDDLLALLALAILERPLHASRDNGKVTLAFESPTRLLEVLKVGEVGLNEFAQFFNAHDARGFGGINTASLAQNSDQTFQSPTTRASVDLLKVSLMSATSAFESLSDSVIASALAAVSDSIDWALVRKTECKRT